jgi:hypothetical protein
MHNPVFRPNLTTLKLDLAKAASQSGTFNLLDNFLTVILEAVNFVGIQTLSIHCFGKHL